MKQRKKDSIQFNRNKAKNEIQNLLSSLSEAKALTYQEILKEIERLSSLKNDLEEDNTNLQKDIDKMPMFNYVVVEDSIKWLKSKIKAKTLEYLRPVILLLIKEIIITNEEIQIKVNLNAYLNTSTVKDLEVVIVEDTDTVIDPEKQFKQKMSWTA